MSYESQWYIPLNESIIQCTLCPHQCILKEGKTGICRVRSNKGARLVSEAYGFVSAIHLDPIEKKPLYHFYPGSKILSIGTYGCNLRCTFCQNSSISQNAVEPELTRDYFSAEKIVQLALAQPGNIGIAFTYNEPIVWYEYMYDIARLAKKAGLKTVMVTNGYISKEPLAALLEYIDAFSVDLKAFSEDFYNTVTSSRLEPVKETLRQIKLAGKHLEIVNLVIPGLNDDDTTFTSMVQWIASELGPDTVLHISRYFPNYKLITEATPDTTMRRIKILAEKKLSNVYCGNMQSGNNHTFCQQCKSVLINRQWYNVAVTGLDDEGKCKSCGKLFHKKT